jgi:hypothetical protein
MQPVDSRTRSTAVVGGIESILDTAKDGLPRAAPRRDDHPEEQKLPPRAPPGPFQHEDLVSSTHRAGSAGYLQTHLDDKSVYVIAAVARRWTPSRPPLTSGTLHSPTTYREIMIHGRQAAA